MIYKTNRRGHKCTISERKENNNNKETICEKKSKSCNKKLHWRSPKSGFLFLLLSFSLSFSSLSNFFSPFHFVYGFIRPHVDHLLCKCCCCYLKSFFFCNFFGKIAFDHTILRPFSNEILIISWLKYNQNRENRK